MDNITIPRYMVEDALGHAGVWDFSIREDYSGRSMYGKTCFGVVLDHGYKGKFLKSLREAIIDGEYTDDELEDLDAEEIEEYDEACALADRVIAKVQVDSMGLSMIVYFPGVSLEGRA